MGTRLRRQDRVEEYDRAHLTARHDARDEVAGVRVRDDRERPIGGQRAEHPGDHSFHAAVRLHVEVWRDHDLQSALAEQWRDALPHYSAEQGAAEQHDQRRRGTRRRHVRSRA